MPYTIRNGAGIIVERATGLNLDWLGPWQVIPGFTGTVTGPGGVAKTWDATTHESAAATGFTQKKTGISDVSDPGGTLLLDPDDTVHQALYSDMAGRIVRQYRFTYPGVTRRHGVEGQISVGGSQADINAGLTAQVTIAAQRVNLTTMP
jgi:hypothetical protein